MAIVTAVAAVAGTAVSYMGQQQQAKAQKQQIASQQRQAEMQNVKEIRSMVRDRYRAAGGIQQAGAAGGVSGSSGVQGGLSSLGAQLAGNVGYMSDVAGEKAVEMNAAMKYAKASQLVGYGQSIASFGRAAGELGSHFYTPTPTA